MERRVYERAIAKRLVADEQILNDAGFEVYEPTDIGEVPELMASTGRSAESPMLGFGNNDFTMANGKFLFLMKDGETIAGCRSKVVDLQGETFESHQRRNMSFWHGTEGDQIEAIAPHLNELIVGKHIYVGELEFRRDYRGSRTVTTALVRVIVAASFLQWPDTTCVYCILPERHWHLSVHYGFNTITRKAYKWRGDPPANRLHDWGVMVSSRSQLIHDWTEGYWGQAPQTQA